MFLNKITTFTFFLQLPKINLTVVPLLLFGSGKKLSKIWLCPLKDNMKNDDRKYVSAVVLYQSNRRQRRRDDCELFYKQLGGDK